MKKSDTSTILVVGGIEKLTYVSTFFVGGTSLKITKIRLNYISNK